MPAFLSILLTTLLVFAIVGTVVVIITDTNSPAEKVVWTALVVLLPVVGLIAYFLLGVNYRRTGYNQRDHRTFLRLLSSYGDGRLSSVAFGPGLADRLLEDYRPLAELLRHGKGSPVVTGTDVTVFTNGQEKLESLLADINAAQHYIHMEYFYFRRGEMGARFKEALMAKAREGVKVRFIRENIANFDIRASYYNEMKQAGVEVVRFSPSLFKLLSVATKLNYRDHRKIAIIDGVTAYTGGMNISDDYYSRWRDTHLRFRGQAVAALQVHFLDSYITSGGTVDDAFEQLFPTADAVPDTGGTLMQLAPGDPDTPWPVLTMAYEWSLSHARNYIWLQTPYLLPPESLLEALKAAALTGCDVRIMVPARTDMWLVTQANRSYYAELLQAGVRIFINHGRFIHSKTMVSDDFLSMVGSSNLDCRSLELSYEMDSVFYDADMATRNRDIFLEDSRECTELTLASWSAALSPLHRVWYDICRLLSPVL